MGMGILATQYTQRKLIRTDGIWPHLLRVWRRLDGKLDLTQKFNIEETLSLAIINNSYFTMGGCPLKSKGESVGLVKLGDFLKLNRRTNTYKPMVEPEVHEYVARYSDQYSSRFRDSYIGIPQIEGPCTFPLGKCVLAGTKIKNFRTKSGGSTRQAKERISLRNGKRPQAIPSIGRLVTNIITSKWTGELNICKRCTTNAVETICHAYLECPAINQLWQTVDNFVCRILGVRAHESTKEDRLFGTDYKTMGYQRERSLNN
ncbi:uncharacterized protein VTP21DRAFT_10772 [Calcarisporiella thermophila]|uniref:uncharacterized protein n=1 Tax=Calcarisporiella thermophila TaxID=911321 RepID=UPI0037421097